MITFTVQTYDKSSLAFLPIAMFAQLFSLAGANGGM